MASDEREIGAREYLEAAHAVNRMVYAITVPPWWLVLPAFTICPLGLLWLVLVIHAV